jgi:hypothetical protein
MTHGGARTMDINRVCVIGPDGMGTIVEQKCKQTGIEVSRVSIDEDLKGLRDTDLVIDQFLRSIRE